MTTEQKIKDMISLLSGAYDPEDAHYLYERLLEEFIKNYDHSLSRLMKELIELPKRFWYA